MKRLMLSGRSLAALMLMAIGAGTVTADWNSFYHHLHIGYHRNNAWPDPFNEADARQVVAPFQVMMRNGWRRHNTIGHEFFRQGDGALLAAGYHRLEWIATQSPETRRQVFVLRGENQSETQARISSVHRALSKFESSGPETQVFVTEVDPPTASGAWATKINRDALDQQVLPVLPEVNAGGTDAAGRSSGGSNTD